MQRTLLIVLLWIIGAALVAGIVIAVDLPHTTPVTQTPSPVASPIAATASSLSPGTNSSAAPSSTSTPRPPTSAAASEGPSKQGLRVHVPTLPAARQTDPLAVAQTVVTTLYSVDPAVDRDASQAAHRAAYLMTPQLAAALTAPQPTGPQWQQWADSGAYVTVTGKKIAIAWTVADNRLRVVRNIGFIQTVHTTTGATALPQQTLAVTLVRDTDDQPWRVASMETP